MMGTVTQQTSNTVATGKVISQDPASGNSVAQGSAVNLVISSGIEVAVTPKINSVLQNSAVAGRYLPVIIEGENFESGAQCDFGPDIVATVVSVTPTQLFATIQVDTKAKTGLRDVTVTQPGSQPSRLPKGFRVVKPRKRIP
jgi:hypothetical protein